MADGKQIGISMTTSSSSSSSSSSSRQAHQPHHRPENSPAADDGAQLAAQLRDRAARCLLRQTQAINNHKQHDNDRTDATFFFFDNNYHAATFTYDDHDTTATRIIENYQTTHAHNYARRAPPPPAFLLHLPLTIPAAQSLGGRQCQAFFSKRFRYLLLGENHGLPRLRQCPNASPSLLLLLLLLLLLAAARRECCNLYA